MLTSVRYLSWRIQCSVHTALSLRGIPLRRIHPSFRCVVVTVSMSPSHLPVENPCHVCAAYSGGCGRPSIQIVRSGACHEIWVCHALTCCVGVSTSFQRRRL